MDIKKLDKKVRSLWLLRSIIGIDIIVVAMVVAILIGKSEDLFLPILITTLSIGIPLILIILILPMLRFKVCRYGYNEEKIYIKKGVIFCHQITIPVCQIQDLHIYEGPIMTMYKLAGISISTAGSDYTISALPKDAAQKMLDELEEMIRSRVGSLKNE